MPPIPFVEMQRKGRERVDGTVIVGGFYALPFYIWFKILLLLFFWVGSCLCHGDFATMYVEDFQFLFAVMLSFWVRKQSVYLFTSDE